jgi:hypothetical protein
MMTYCCLRITPPNICKAAVDLTRDLSVLLSFADFPLSKLSIFGLPSTPTRKSFLALGRDHSFNAMYSTLRTIYYSVNDSGILTSFSLWTLLRCKPDHKSFSCSRPLSPYFFFWLRSALRIGDSPASHSDSTCNANTAGGYSLLERSLLICVSS